MKNFPCPTRSGGAVGVAAALLFFLFLMAEQPGVARAADKRIDTIREIYKTAKERIARAESGDEASEFFINELIINRAEAPYPAVGTYRSRQRFYYTFGDRERAPYPNRLRMVLIETQRSGVEESEEYLFADSGDLVFYFNRIGDAEQRMYFAERKLIRRLDGQRQIGLATSGSEEAAKIAQESASKLMSIFRNSL